MSSVRPPAARNDCDLSYLEQQETRQEEGKPLAQKKGPGCTVCDGLAARNVKSYTERLLLSGVSKIVNRSIMSPLEEMYVLTCMFD